MDWKEKIENATVSNELFEDLTPEEMESAETIAKISKSLILERNRRGMTQGEMAKLLGVSQGMVSKWESAEYNFTVSSLVKIALKLNLDYQIGLTKNVEGKSSFKVQHSKVSYVNFIKEACWNGAVACGA